LDAFDSQILTLRIELKKLSFVIKYPDAGSLKKIYKLAEKLTQSQFNLKGVVECSKLRNVEDGKITGVTAHCDDLLGRDCYIVDDICDSGETFKKIFQTYQTEYSFPFNLKFACLHFKPHTSHFNPEFSANKFFSDAWISYPWEREDSKTIQDYKL
jgi:hypoxanthine phosphoribosyltransferase